MTANSDILFLSLPLNKETHHIIDNSILNTMKPNALIINVARGAIVDTEALINTLDRNRLGGYATDVYEKEKGIFFYDHSDNPPEDPLLEKLLKHPKILLTPHQAFATTEALRNIAATTVASCDFWELDEPSRTTIYPIKKNENDTV